MNLHRGHAIVRRRGAWLYGDGVPVADDPDRACGHCGLANTPDGHDGCLGVLRHVANACCGHGTVTDAYVQLRIGDVLRGEDAQRFIDDQRFGTIAARCLTQPA